MIYDSPFDLVGNTPVVKVGTYNNAVLWAKLEGANPSGSLKDRTASTFIQQGIKEFGLKRTFIDASSGSYACALAYYSRVAQTPCTVVVNSKISDDNLAFLYTQGATVVKHGAVTGESRQHCLELIKDSPNNWIFTDQLTNLQAAEIHEQTTAAEIFSALPNVTAIVGSKGSGATLCGITRAVSKRASPPKVFGSVGIIGDEKKIAGTYVEGPDFVSSFIRELSVASHYTGDIAVTYQSAMKTCRELPVLVGPQGGGVYTAALMAVDEHNLSGDVLMVMGDSLQKNISRFS